MLKWQVNFSVLLTLAMLLTLVPAMGVTVSAAETWTTVTTYDEPEAAHTGSARKSSLILPHLLRMTAPTHQFALYPRNSGASVEWVEKDKKVIITKPEIKKAETK